MAARQWLELEARNAEPWVRLRAVAAVKLAEGCPSEAIELIEEALGQLRAVPASGAHEYETELLRVMQAGSVLGSGRQIGRGTWS